MPHSESFRSSERRSHERTGERSAEDRLRSIKESLERFEHAAGVRRADSPTTSRQSDEHSGDTGHDE